MPIINLGPFGRYSLSKLHDTAEQQSLLEDKKYSKTGGTASKSLPSYTSQGENCVPLGLPPKEIRHCAPPKAQKPNSRVQQLQRYILEILAITFSANFDTLNRALQDPTSEGTTTILCDEERSELLALSGLVRKCHDQLHRVPEIRIEAEDEMTLSDEISQPGLQLEYNLSEYALELIEWYGSYTRACGNSHTWQYTIPGYWEKNPTMGFNNLKESMRTFSLIIEHTAPSQHVFDILHEAWDVCREKRGLECEHEFLRSSNPIYWARRNGYDLMGSILSLHGTMLEVAGNAPVRPRFLCGKPPRFLWKATWGGGGR